MKWNKLCYYIKQLFPLSYWTTVIDYDEGLQEHRYSLILWRQWFGKPFDICHVDLGPVKLPFPLDEMDCREA